MSIYVEINELVNEMVNDGRLYHLSPAFTGYTKRRMYVSPEVNDFVVGPWRDEKTSRQGNALRAVIDRYLDGRRVTVSNDKDADVNMKQLTPTSDEVWEIRSKKEPPAIRVFGSFVKKDIFVGLTWAFRIELGEIDSKEWELALRAYKHEWKKLFHAYTPLSGDNFNEYLSNILPL